MLTYVLGAPGSGKSTLVPLLRDRLAMCAVVDWDAFMEPATALVGRDIRSDPATWPSYAALVRSAIEALGPVPVVLLGVCTPDELAGWPISRWAVLDCSDEERRRRLDGDGRGRDVADAVADAQRYRGLGLPVVDTTDQTPDSVADTLVRLITSE